jgi:hypothetical protein
MVACGQSFTSLRIVHCLVCLQATRGTKIRPAEGVAHDHDKAGVETSHDER